MKSTEELSKEAGIAPMSLSPATLRVVSMVVERAREPVMESTEKLIAKRNTLLSAARRIRALPTGTP